MILRTELENIYEAMLVPVGPMTVSLGPGPENPFSTENEDMTEEDEVNTAKKILRLTDTLDDLASEAHVKTYRRRIEDISESIRLLAKKYIKGHPEV